MSRFILKKVVFLFIAMAAHSGIWGESISVYDLQKATGAVLRWDPFRGQGMLVKNGKLIEFKPGIPFLVLDYDKIETISPVSTEKGNLLFPDDAVQKIRTFFTEPVSSPDSHLIRTIIIDPGHGGRDTGTVASHTIDGKKVTLVEKEIALEVSLDVARLLEEKYPEKSILLTRKTDVFPSLEDRVELANAVPLKENESIIFISVHVNSSPFNRAARGFEAWYLPPDYRRDLIDPSSVAVERKDILPILNTMKEEEYTLESVLLARTIMSGIQNMVGSLSPGRGLKEESWFVVRNAKMASVLLELGFITNESEATLLNKPSYLKKLSEGIYNGVNDFISGFEQPGSKTE